MIKNFKIFLLALLGTFAFTTSAWAGPAVIIGAIIGGGVAAGAAAAGFIAASVLTAAAIGAVVGAVAGALSGSLLGGFLDTPDYNVTQNAQTLNDGVLVNKIGMLEHIPVVYGQRKVGGTVVFLSTAGDRNKYLYMALVLCEGEIEAIDDVYINNIISTDSRFSGRVTIEKFAGSDGQSASTILQEASGWSTNHKLSGLAYLGIRFEWKKIEDQEDADANPFSGIPKVQAVIRGKKVTTANGKSNTYSTAYTSESGQAYSNNPADCLMDYLRNPRYGKGLANDRINFASFDVAFDKFAQTVNYFGGGSGPIVTCDAVIDTSRSILNNTKVFLANMRSGMPYQQGRFKLKLQDTGHATDSQNTTPEIAFAVTRDHIVGGIKLKGAGTREHFNQIKLTYVDPTNEWKTNEVIHPQLNSARDQELLNEDNGRRLTKELAFNHITNKNQAADLAHIILEQSRKTKSIAFTATAELHETEVGDIITVTYDLLGFSAVKYRITSWKMNADYTISLTANEHEPTTYIFADTDVKYGADTQKHYVGGGAQSKYYYWNNVSGYNSANTPPPNSNQAQLPINTNQITSSVLGINSVTSKAKYDRPSFATETLQFNVTMADSFIDQIKQVDLQELSGNTNTYVSRTTLNPTTLAKSGSAYLLDINSELDGRTHTFRLLATLDNGDTIPSATTTHTASLSIYRTTSFVSF